MSLAERSGEKPAGTGLGGKAQHKKQDALQPASIYAGERTRFSAQGSAFGNKRTHGAIPDAEQLQQSIGNQAVLRGLESRLHPASVAGVFPLQPLIGNHALGVRLQAKLKVNMPGDHFEQEADRMAEQVMRMPSSEAAAAPTVSRTVSGVQRKCSCGDGSAAPCDECQEEQKLQRCASAPVANGYAPPIVHEVLRSPGRPLDAATRAFMEPRFGHDFSSVRVHADTRAAESARSVHAIAYTVGHDVVLDPRSYASGTREGGQLLAHELTHVVQQTEVTAPRLQRISVSTNAPHELMRQSRGHGGATRPTTPTLGGCRPVQDDLRPTAPWATLQVGYRARCSSAARDVAGQVERSLSDIVHGRMPAAPHLPDPRSSVDCACALGTPRQAALAALPVVAAAGRLAARLYLHFLDATGTPMTIDVDDMIRRSTGVRQKIRRSIARGGMTGTTRLEQSDYGDRELQFAYGAIDCVQWQALPPAGRSWRSDPATHVRVSMLDYYEFHPGRPGVSQCAHAACVECVARGDAKNFWTRGDAVVSWGQLKR